MRRTRKLAVVATSVLALTGAGVAFAAWTSSGSGSGTATASSAATLTVTAGDPTGLYPTGTVQIPVTVTNTNPYAVEVTAIDFTGSHTTTSGCTASTVTAASTTYSGLRVDAGDTVTRNLTVSMSNAAEDACQGAVFTLDFTATASSVA